MTRENIPCSEPMTEFDELAAWMNFACGLGGSIGPHQWDPDVKKATDAARTRVSGYTAEHRRELEGRARTRLQLGPKGVFRSSVL